MDIFYTMSPFPVHSFRFLATSPETLLLLSLHCIDAAFLAVLPCTVHATYGLQDLQRTPKPVGVVTVATNKEYART